MTEEFSMKCHQRDSDLLREIFVSGFFTPNEELFAHSTTFQAEVDVARLRLYANRLGLGHLGGRNLKSFNSSLFPS